MIGHFLHHPHCNIRARLSGQPWEYTRKSQAESFVIDHGYSATHVPDRRWLFGFAERTKSVSGGARYGSCGSAALPRQRHGLGRSTLRTKDGGWEPPDPADCLMPLTMHGIAMVRTF